MNKKFYYLLIAVSMLFTSCNNDLTVDKDDCLRETGHEHCENIP